MNIMTLNTGWKKWDKFLSKFVGKKINCLDIGSYEGASTCWMLKNLCTHPESKVYSIDTWEGSPEYGNMDFSKIEKKFDENVKKIGKKSQNVKLKMISIDGLIKLKNDKIYFDFIFIDASHEAISVMTDAILSWDILKSEGILIFDDYEWDKLSKDIFKPKIAIDSFVYIFSSQLITLYIGYQYIIEKKKYEDYIKPELEKYYSITNDIDTFKQCNIEYEIDIANNKKLIFDLTMKQKHPEFIETENFKKYLEILKKDNFELNNKYYNIDPNRLLLFYKEETLEKSLSKKIYDQILKNKNNPFIKFYEQYEKSGKNIENPIYEIITQLYDLKILKKNNNILNFTHSTTHIPDKIRSYINDKFKLNLQYDEISYENHKLYNIDEIMKNNFIKKYDIIIISLTNLNLILKNKIDYEKYYTIQLFYSLLFCFLNLTKNGTMVNISFGFNTNVSIQLLWIIKKYFNKITLTCYNSAKITTTTTKIIASDFNGLSNNELEEFINIAEKIKLFNSTYDDEKLYLIHNFLKIDNNNTIYNNFYNEIMEYNKIKNNLVMNNNLIWYKIIDYFQNNTNDNEKNKLKNYIYTKQLKNVLWWINKYGF